MLICALTAACLTTGCAGSTSQGSAPAAQGSPQSDGSDEPDDSGDPAPNGQDSPVPSPQDIPDSDESAVSDWGTADSGNNTIAKDTPNNSGTADADDSETGTAAFRQVLVDREDLYFAIKDVKDESSIGYSWQVYIENRTDKNLMFSFEKVAVNGVMCDPYWAEVIPAGRKGNCEIVWLRDSLDPRQIADVRKVAFTLNVYNDDDYAEAPIMHDPFTVYPLGQDEAADTPDVREPAPSDRILVDNEDCTVLVTGFDPDNSWGFVMNLYLVNRTGKDLVFSADNTSVNDGKCCACWTEIVTAGSAAYSAVLWDKGALEESEIQEVGKISFPLCVFSDLNIAEPLIDETFTLKP